MLIFCLSYIALLTLPSVLIDIVQIKYVKSRAKSPAVILPPQDYEISARYALENLKLSIINTLYDTIIFVAWVCVGLRWWQEILIEESGLGFIVFVLGFLLISWGLNLPFKAYKELFLDKKYGFSNANKAIFFSDMIKAFALIVVFGFLVLWILLWVMEYEYWWVLGFGIIFCLVVLVNMLYPTLIAPMFNTFTPLNDEHLQSKIESLMQKAGFKTNGIFVMDASRRDDRLNAYFGGLGTSKRVVLFDTLLDKVSSDGLLAILGHELGHFKNKDIIFNLFVSGLILFGLFFVAGHLPSVLFETLGVLDNSATTIVMLLLIAPVIAFWVMPISAYFSRRAEYKSDLYGASLTSPHCLKEALIRLVNENKSFPHSHPLYTFFHYTHPPLLERLCVLDSLISTSMQKDEAQIDDTHTDCGKKDSSKTL